MLVVQPGEGPLGAHFPVLGDKCIVFTFFEGLEPEFGPLLDVVLEGFVDPEGTGEISLKV